MKTIILTNLDSSNIEINNSVNKLSNDRLERATKYANGIRRTRYYKSELLTISYLREYSGLLKPIVRGKVGERPYLMDSEDVSFNKSYSDNYLAFALEINGFIAIDIEHIKLFDERCLEYFFTDNERNYIKSSNSPELAYSIIWTRKESYIKCLGRGLCYPLQNLDVTPKKAISYNSSCNPVFNNDKVNTMFVSSYVYKNLVISVCSTVKSKIPKLMVLS